MHTNIEQFRFETDVDVLVDAFFLILAEIKKLNNIILNRYDIAFDYENLARTESGFEKFIVTFSNKGAWALAALQAENYQEEQRLTLEMRDLIFAKYDEYCVKIGKVLN